MTEEERQQLDAEHIEGNEAERLLNHPLVKAFFSDFQGKIVSQLANAKITGKEANADQQRLIILLQSSQAFEEYFKDKILTGKFARKSLFNSDL